MARKFVRGRRRLRRKTSQSTVKRHGRSRYGKRTRWTRRGTPFISVKRTCYLGAFTPNSTTTNGFWQYRTVSLTKGFFDASAASMGGLSNLTEYTSLFDLYKLGAVKITLRPNQQNMQSDQVLYSSSTTQNIPYVSICIDPTDNVSPTGVYNATTYNAFMEQGNRVRTKRADRTFSVYLKPKVIEQYGNGADRYVSPRWTRLDNTAGQDMPHRGYHMFFHNQAFSAGFMTYDVFVTYYLRFKGAR